MALGATALSLAFNVAAGYAFAKLRFAGRQRLFRTLLGALVTPAQVTMMPLFLMLERMGLVNTLPGVLIPWLASVLGIFLVTVVLSLAAAEITYRCVERPATRLRTWRPGRHADVSAASTAASTR